MHNNYYFLRQLSKTLGESIIRFSLVSCFSQNKDELIIEFNDGKTSFFIKALLSGSFSCISFPSEFNRASKNSVDLFSTLLLKKVIGVYQFENERSFEIQFEGNHSLIFKMHSNRANVLLARQDSILEIFRNQFKSDLDLNSAALDRSIDWSKNAFIENHNQLRKHYFTFGKEIWRQLAKDGFENESSDNQWDIFNKTLSYLEEPKFYILKNSEKYSLSLFSDEKQVASFSDPITAINEFFHLYVSNLGLAQEKSGALKRLKTTIESYDSYIFKNSEKLKGLEQDTHYKTWADLIMANMDAVKKGATQVMLEDFNSKNLIKIKLKPELTAQKNAEIFYRKSKNKEIEINKLKESITSKEQAKKDTLDLIQQIETAESLKDFRKIYKNSGAKPKAQQEEKVPYHKFEYDGFQIWVGKNAISNDQLTLKYSHKDDLWLHAKDVSGSHVLIKYKSGHKFPKDVIERAAELAAYNSKRKSEALCPVAYTPKKFVRKRKGDPAGMVVVEREQVIMVTPKLID